MHRLVISFFLALSVFVFSTIIFFPTHAQLESTPEAGVFVIDCGFGPSEESCGISHLFELARKLMQVLIWLATIGVAFVIIWYGAALAMNSFMGDYNSIVQKARKSILWALAGLVLVLGAWLIIEFLFRTLGYKDVDTLFDYQPVSITPSTTTPPEEPGPVSPPSPDRPLTARTDRGISVCLDCVDLSVDIPCKSSECKIDSGLNDKLENLRERADFAGWRVTEAWPPTTRHRADCHYYGTCVDINFCNASCDRSHPRSHTAENIRNFIEAAEESGLRAVYEVNNLRTYDELVRSGIAPSESGSPGILFVSGITAPHFSVYDS